MSVGKIIRCRGNTGRYCRFVRSLFLRGSGRCLRYRVRFPRGGTLVGGFFAFPFTVLLDFPGPLLGPLGLPTGFLVVGLGLGLTFSSVFSLSMSIVGMADISVLIGM